jgi:hypothetical protein
MFSKFEERCKLGRQSAYAQLDWQHRHHHIRHKRYVESMPKKLPCQECGGSGDLLEDRICGHNLYVDCGWCEGIGYVTPWLRGQWLRYKRKGS